MEQRSSKLLLKAICNGEIKDSAEVVNFDFNGIENREERLNRIRKLFGEILKSPVKKCKSEYNTSLGYKEVEISEEKVKLVSPSLIRKMVCALSKLVKRRLSRQSSMV